MAKQNTELLPSAAQTASAAGGSMSISTHNMAMVTVEVTAKSGTTPTLKVWLQASDDSGESWYDYPYDQAMLTSSSGTDVTASTNKRNICESADALGQWAAVYKHLPPGNVRARWDIGGTTPSFTFSVKLAGA
jgi:hypothetical protein